MAPRSSATFTKRQKEQARREKQQAKQERKLQRKLEKRETPPGSEVDEFGTSTEVSPDSEPLSDSGAAATEAASIERESQ